MKTAKYKFSSCIYFWNYNKWKICFLLDTIRFWGGMKQWWERHSDDSDNNDDDEDENENVNENENKNKSINNDLTTQIPLPW